MESKNIQTTYVMVKPGFANNPIVIYEIKKRILNAGLEIKSARYLNYDVESASKHYAEHCGKAFYNDLIDYITSDKVYAMIVKGENAVSVIRAMAGGKGNLIPGTIRYDIPMFLGQPLDATKNVIHSSSGVNEAKEEIAIAKQLSRYSKQVDL